MEIFKFSLVFIFYGLLSYGPGNAQALEAEGIIGGQNVKSYEINYLVGIFRNNKYTCSGGIIHSKFILTAAHCVVDENDEFRKGNFKIIAGTHDLKSDDPYKIEIPVSMIHIPSIYNGSLWHGGSPEGDIAVLKLEYPLVPTSQHKMQKLKLPPFSIAKQKTRTFFYPQVRPYINSIAVIAGFGWNKINLKDTENGPVIDSGSTDLRARKANAYVIDYEDCRNYYEIIYESNLCAKVINYLDDTPQGVCSGDSGSPLVYNDDMVIGVLSGVEPTCNENYIPGVYTKVSSYIYFIRNVKIGLLKYMRVKTADRNGNF